MIGVPSAMTPDTGATSGNGSLRMVSSAALRSFRPSSSSRVSSSCVRATAPLGDEQFLAREPALHDRDLLIEFALFLAHVGNVDRLRSAA